MDIRLNDILVMKKPHPCGEKRWLVLRTGADFRLRCLGCGHELMTRWGTVFRFHPAGNGRTDGIAPLAAETRSHRQELAADPTVQSDFLLCTGQVYWGLSKGMVESTGEPR